jgi:hypothetical protein
VDRLRVLLPGLWAGLLLCMGLIAAPAPFATLLPADAGRVVARMFAQEAYFSLVLAVAVVLLERRRSQGLNAQILLALGALFCTVAGYFAVQPLMAAARAGQGALSFGLLHAVSLGFFTLKGLLVLALAWRVATKPIS